MEGKAVWKVGEAWVGHGESTGRTEDGGGGGGSGVVLCGSRAALGQRKAIPGKLCDLQRRAWPALEHAPGAEERLLL